MSPAHRAISWTNRHDRLFLWTARLPVAPTYGYSAHALDTSVAVLGSTGSIGTSTLSVIEHLGPPWRAIALSAHRQTKLLLEQVDRFKPSAVAVTDPAAYNAVCSQLSGKPVTVYAGPQGLVDMVQRDDVDVVLAAIVGSAGLPAVIAAIEAKKKLALANKEALVVAGSLVIPLARKLGVSILPVDSEHSAVFQAMQAGKPEQVRRVILTASGGPFRNATHEQIENATLADALNHPTWRMGSKITIDSATMFNKALELIEACWLFDIPPEKIEIVIHPESLVHSMVEFIDGSVIAQLSPPDMRTPIQYALTYPDRADGCSRRLDLVKAFSMTFQPPDVQRFPAIGVAYDVARKGGTAGAVLNGANEAAVAAFMKGRIRFGQIARIVCHTIGAHQVRQSPTLGDLVEADRWARATAESYMTDRTLVSV